MQVLCVLEHGKAVWQYKGEEVGKGIIDLQLPLFHLKFLENCKNQGRNISRQIILDKYF